MIPNILKRREKGAGTAVSQIDLVFIDSRRKVEGGEKCCGDVIRACTVPFLQKYLGHCQHRSQLSDGCRKISSTNKIWQVTTLVNNLHIRQLKYLSYRRASSP